MKVRATTLLSVVGVLVAGSAAALVNAEVLQPSTAPQAAAPTVVGPTPTLPLSTVPEVAAPAPATQATYQIATAGAVTLDTSGDVLTVVNVTPYGEWVVVGVESTAGNVEIELQHGITVVEFSASLVEGIVSTGVEVSQIVTEAPDSDDEHPATTVAQRPGGTTPATPATTTTVSGGEDEHEEDEHDDDD